MPTTYAIPDGSKQMYINLYTGTSGSQTLTNNSPSNPAGFQAGLQWFKSRSNATNNVLHDVLRGTAGVNRLFSDSTSAESTTGDGFVSINSNGFTLDGSGGGGDVNTSGRTYVAWQWAAPATGTTNTAGSITSSVSANTTAGFSVVTYSANGSTGTVGHGLGVAPSMIIVKKRNAIERWCVYHISTSNAYLYLNESNASETANAQLRFGNNSSVVQPTSTLFTIGNSNDVNGTSGTYVAYCWTPIAGYSQFGSYTGNGSADGPFIYTGFKPQFVMFKNTTAANVWLMLDASRNPYNVVTLNLNANSTAADNSNTWCDFNSNGFKVRNASDGAINTSSANYIYMAFASNPFKFANAG
jgi:hypothetical protein